MSWFRYLAVFVALLAVLKVAPEAHSADDDEVFDVTGWKKPGPFTARTPGSISGVADIDPGANTRVSVQASCVGSDIELAVGVMKGEFDVESADPKYHRSGLDLPVQQVFDAGSIEVVQPVEVQNARSISFVSGAASKLLQSRVVQIGVSIDGGKVVLRISIQDVAFRGLVSQCEANYRKAENEKSRQAGVAAEAQRRAEATAWAQAPVFRAQSPNGNPFGILHSLEEFDPENSSIVAERLISPNSLVKVMEQKENNGRLWYRVVAIGESGLPLKTVEGKVITGWGSVREFTPAIPSAQTRSSNLQTSKLIHDGMQAAREGRCDVAAEKIRIAAEGQSAQQMDPDLANLVMAHRRCLLLGNANGQ